jgi:hypothetical protein
MNTLPGTVIPIATIFIISTIYWYSIRLKSQIMKEFQNNIIIQENEEKLKQLAYYAAVRSKLFKTEHFNLESFFKRLSTFSFFSRV